jgi:hypothetical protein
MIVKECRRPESIMDALQRLIHQRMAELRRSYGDVARRGGLPRSTVHHLATHARVSRLPNPGTLERLAAGLDLPLDEVRSAAAQAAGLAVDRQAVDDPEIEVLVASLTRLSPADRQHVAALVRSLLAATESAS